MSESFTARGVISREPGQPGVVEEFQIDPPGSGEVLVRILASGVCHTDLSAKNGVFGTDPFPWLLGHEGSGTVERLGEGVTNVREGDFVILAWRAPCGECRFCLRGELAFCANSLNAKPRMRTHDGIQLTPVLGIGTFCTHTVVHSHQCIPISDDLPPVQMSLIGCGVMTGIGAALYAGGVKAGESVAVIGCGGVGDSAIMGAKIAGATTIIAVDIDERKLAWAREFGATHAVNPNDGDAVEAIKAITGGFGVNVAIEAVGSPRTIETALWSRDLAGRCVIVGVAGRDAQLTLPVAQFFDRGGKLSVSWYGDCLPTRDFPILASWYAEGRLDLDRMVTRTITLDETEEAFHAMERGETLRSVIVMAWPPAPSPAAAGVGVS